MDWINTLVDPKFMPHGHCYLWRPDILWTHVVSDAVIAASYYAIPAVLAILLYKRRSTIPFKEILLLFVAFIFFCGTTHLVRIYVTWVPIYEIEGWLKAATALISFVTVLVLVPLLPRLLTLPDLQSALDESEQAVTRLKEQNEEMESIYNTAINREERILVLKEEVNALLNQLGQEDRYTTKE